MSRRYYQRKQSSGVGSAFGLLFILGIGGLVAYQGMSDDTRIMAGAILAAAALVILGLVILMSIRRRVSGQRKLRALSVVDIGVMDGLVFEKYVAELLKSRSYQQVKLTERYDLGIDIIAVKDGVRWGIQVKRYTHMVKLAAVQQVVAALQHYGCDRPMVITNSIFSRPAQNLAKSSHCILIDKDILAQWIVDFQRAKV